MVPFEADIESCLRVLQDGGLILYPTDTIWGIGCDATNARAVSKIFELKKRPEGKSLIVLIADERDILKYVSHPDPGIFDFLRGLNRPTTVIYPDVLHLAENLSYDGQVGIRLVKEIFCKHLIKRFRKPIASTSANISGLPAPAHFGAIDPAIVAAVDYAVQYRRDDLTNRQPSAVIKYHPDGTVTVIRE